MKSGILSNIWTKRIASVLGLLYAFYLCVLSFRSVFYEVIIEKPIMFCTYLSSISIVFIILMIPGTPKDVITYMTSLTDIKPFRFYLLATIARIPAVTSLTLMGSTLSKGKPIMTVIIFLITGAIGITGIFFNNYITAKRNNKINYLKQERK